MTGFSSKESVNTGGPPDMKRWVGDTGPAYRREMRVGSGYHPTPPYTAPVRTPSRRRGSLTKADTSATPSTPIYRDRSSPKCGLV